MPRGSRKKQEIDVTQFKPLVDEALKAFASHVAYAEAMTRAAVTIENKRSVHRIRRDVKKAESEARAKCEKRRFPCYVDNPCGTGACRFASAEMSKVDLEAPGKTERPRNSRTESYSIEPVVKHLQKQTPSSVVRPDGE